MIQGHYLAAAINLEKFFLPGEVLFAFPIRQKQSNIIDQEIQSFLPLMVDPMLFHRGQKA